jgi:hypothetical protein
LSLKQIIYKFITNMNVQLNKFHFIAKGMRTLHGHIESRNILFLTEQNPLIDMVDEK